MWTWCLHNWNKTITWLVLEYSYVSNQSRYALHIPLAHTCLYYCLLSPQYTILHTSFYCTSYSSLLFLILFIYVYSLVLCYIFCTVHWADLTYISLLIIFCIIEYVTNKTLNPLYVGEGCVALRSAENSYTEFCIKLTHHGEHTGRLTGGIQLPKSDGKQTEKLYGESTVRFCTAEPVQNCAITLSSPSIEAVFLSSRLCFFILDFIKVGDDPGAGKGKSGDSTKM